MNLALSRQPFWRYVWLLLRLRVQIIVRDFLRAKRGRKIGMIILVLVIVGLIGFAFFASWWLLGFLGTEASVGSVSCHSTPFLERQPPFPSVVVQDPRLRPSTGTLAVPATLTDEESVLLDEPREPFVDEPLDAFGAQFSSVRLRAFAAPRFVPTSTLLVACALCAGRLALRHFVQAPASSLDEATLQHAAEVPWETFRILPAFLRREVDRSSRGVEITARRVEDRLGAPELRGGYHRCRRAESLRGESQNQSPCRMGIRGQLLMFTGLPASSRTRILFKVGFEAE